MDGAAPALAEGVTEGDVGSGGWLDINSHLLLANASISPELTPYVVIFRVVYEIRRALNWAHI